MFGECCGSHARYNQATAAIAEIQIVQSSNSELRH